MFLARMLAIGLQVKLVVEKINSGSTQTPRDESVARAQQCLTIEDTMGHQERYKNQKILDPLVYSERVGK